MDTAAGNYCIKYLLGMIVTITKLRPSNEYHMFPRTTAGLEYKSVTHQHGIEMDRIRPASRARPMATAGPSPSRSVATARGRPPTCHEPAAAYCTAPPCYKASRRWLVAAPCPHPRPCVPDHPVYSRAACLMQRKILVATLIPSSQNAAIAQRNRTHPASRIPRRAQTESPELSVPLDRSSPRGIREAATRRH